MDVKEILTKAAESVSSLQNLQDNEVSQILREVAAALREATDVILEANSRDLERMSPDNPKYDRLKLTPERLDGIASDMENVAGLPSPLGKVLSEVERPNGMCIKKVSVPFGVIGVIYEARPNVTVDSAALCLKTGNAVVLRGGKEAINTNKALVSVIKEALVACGFDGDAVGLIQSTDRESANALMSMRGLVDVLIPRGGKGLINACVQNSKVPVIETGAGNCHLYVDEYADLDKAVKIAVNAKCSRPSVCNAIETVLVHSSVAEKFLPMMAEAFSAYNVDIRGCERTCAIINANRATDEDFATEYDDYIVSVGVVDSVDEAITHINKYSTGHSEAIVTENMQNADKFLSRIDSVAVYLNASTRFTDGGEFGFGAEIGISTQKLHVRGPMGLMALTTEKYLIVGDGAVR